MEGKGRRRVETSFKFHAPNFERSKGQSWFTIRTYLLNESGENIRTLGFISPVRAREIGLNCVDIRFAVQASVFHLSR